MALRKRYRPADDPGVKEMKKARTEKQRRELERQFINDTDNRTKNTDPPQRVKKS